MVSFEGEAVCVCVDEIVVWYLDDVVPHFDSCCCEDEGVYCWCVVFLWFCFDVAFDVEIEVVSVDAVEDFVAFLEVVWCFCAFVECDDLSCSVLCEFAESCVGHSFVEVLLEWTVGMES